MIETNGESESGKSVQRARHDDDFMCNIMAEGFRFMPLG